MNHFLLVGELKNIIFSDIKFERRDEKFNTRRFDLAPPGQSSTFSQVDGADQRGDHGNGRKHSSYFYWDRPVGLIVPPGSRPARPLGSTISRN